MNTPTKTVFKNPHDLKMHWTRKLLPDTKGTELVGQLSDEIARGARLPAIYIVEPNLVVAGWTRKLAHQARQVDVECIVVSEEQAVHVAMKENTLRQHYSRKFQIGFSYCPMAVMVVEKAHAIQIANLKQGIRTESATNALSVFLPATLEEFADQIGISRRLLLDCKATCDALAAWDAKHAPKKWGEDKDKKTALAYWSSRILDDEEPCTPGNARAGIAGSDAGADGKTKPEPRQLQLFTDGLASVSKWGKSFTKFEGGEKKKAVDAIRKTVSAWPAELRHEFAIEIKRIEREEKETAQ